MTYAELSFEDRLKMSQMITNIIGTKEDWLASAKTTQDRISQRDKYNKMFDKLSKVFIKYGYEQLALTYQDFGSRKQGTTASGKKWILDMNNGSTKRSWTCGTLYIQGEGCIFTSGSLSRVFEYILTK